MFNSLRVVLSDRIQGTPKENENNLSQTRTKPTEKPTTQGPKVISRFRIPVGPVANIDQGDREATEPGTTQAGPWSQETRERDGGHKGPLT